LGYRCRNNAACSCFRHNQIYNITLLETPSSLRSQDIEKDPRKLWVALKEYYDQYRAIILPETWREWSPLRLMNFKSITEYNYAVLMICCKLQFCDQIIDDAEMIKKTLFIFSFLNRLLQQQYH